LGTKSKSGSRLAQETQLRVGGLVSRLANKPNILTFFEPVGQTLSWMFSHILLLLKKKKIPYCLEQFQ
jgi:hypothetical protein